MSISTNHRLCLAALVAAVVCACSNGPANQTREYAGPAGTGSGGLVGPLKDDTSERDRVLGRWTGRHRLGGGSRRNASGPSTDISTTPIRSAPRSTVSAAGRIPGWPGAGSGNNPVGFNGVPFVLFKTILDLDPNHANPTLRAIARIWKREAIVPAGSGTSATTWTLDHIGVGPDPSDYVDGVARPASQRQSPLPFGFAFENPRSFEPLSAAETDGRRCAVAGATRLSEHESADRQAANGGQGGELGTRPAGFRQPRRAWIVCSFRARPATSAA